MLYGGPGQRSETDTLSAYSVLRTRDLDEARERVATVLSPHELKTGRNHGLDTYMASAPLGGVSINRLRYGTTVDIDVGCTGDFALVMMPLRGTAEVTCGNQTIRSTPMLASVVSPTLPLRMTSRDDCDQIMVRLDRLLLERHCERHLGHALDHPIEFALDMDLSGPSGTSWRALLSYLVSELDRGSDLLESPIARAQIENMLANTLLLAQPHRYRDELLRPARIVAPAFIRRAEDFIRAHADQPITVGDVAAHAGVSLSTLFAGFRTYRNTTPMAFLKHRRLLGVREQLMAAKSDESVTRIAMQWGFAHLGRFASEYKRQFGELPSETLRR